MQEKVTIKSESEKMIPLDTSGNSVDVEIKEESSTPENEVEVKDAVITEVVEEKSAETPTEELEEYSAGVKKRIDKLTKKMREAERREEAAIVYTKNVNEKYKQALSTSALKDDTFLRNAEEKVNTQEAFAKRALEAALKAQDVEKQVEAQQELSRLVIEKERINLSKQKREQLKDKPIEGEAMPAELSTGGKPQQRELPPVDPKAVSWAKTNKWFGQDKVKTYAAMGIHEELVEEGFDATSEEYYTEVDNRLNQRFSSQVTEDRKPTQKVASAVRTSSTGRRTVRLTPSQVAISKKLGVPLEEYAKHVKEA
jgi:hypothetical protein